MNQPPHVIDGKYQLLRAIGQGGMGAVYEARHLGTNRRVALKLIVPEALQQGADILRRFQIEARASGAIESIHVVQVLDTGIDAETKGPYMVMELLAGEDVQQLVDRIGPLPPEVALRIIAQAAVGLRRAHDAGIIHRDIKSANLFLARQDNGDVVVKLLDFGVAKVRADPLATPSDHGLTRTGSMLGSPLYMSPEQAKGQRDLDHRSDIWSLGVVLHEALVGTPPNHECETLGALIIAICSPTLGSVQDDAPWLSADVAAIVQRARAPNRDARFQSAGEMHEAIMALLPDGATLRESMFVPLHASARAPVAPRLSPLAASVEMSAARSTISGFGATTAANRVRPKRLRWIGPAAVLLALGGVTAGIALKPRQARRLEAPAPSISAVPIAAASVVAEMLDAAMADADARPLPTTTTRTAAPPKAVTVRMTASAPAPSAPPITTKTAAVPAVDRTM